MMSQPTAGVIGGSSLLAAMALSGLGLLLDAGLLDLEETAALLRYCGAVATFAGARALARCPDCRHGDIWHFFSG